MLKLNNFSFYEINNSLMCKIDDLLFHTPEKEINFFLRKTGNLIEGTIYLKNIGIKKTIDYITIDNYDIELYDEEIGEIESFLIKTFPFF